MLMQTDSFAFSSLVVDSTGIPPLPDVIKAQEVRAHLASPTLDAMIDYFRHWATRSYEGYHEAVALWVLSTIAARRVVLSWRRGVWTPLYLMIVSRSTAHAKTEAAFYGSQILESCGLDFLLVPDETTPQRLLSRMSGKMVPRNYSTMNPDERESFCRSAAFSGQKGWQYDEFGDLLQEVIKGRGSNAQFYRLLKQLYDSKTTFKYDTISRGEEKIDMPYLSIIGTTAPDSLAPIAGSDSPAWTDGAFARIAWIVPPSDSLKLDSAPDGSANVPQFIKDRLLAWHYRLGEPTCEVVDLAEQEELLDQALGTDRNKRKQRDAPEYRIDRGELPQSQVYWTDSGVHAAHELYYASLATMGRDYNLDERFRSNYGRLPDMALKIAMLLASLENNGHMDMRHWGRGQQIAERWRYNLHELIAQLSTGHAKPTYGDLESAVIEVLEKKFQPGEKFNRRRVVECGGRFIRAKGSQEIGKVLDELAGTDASIGSYKIGHEGAGRNAVYWLLEKTEEKKEGTV